MEQRERARGAESHVRQTSHFARLLAAQPTPLVDRKDELDAILQRLTVDGTRLLTLTGPGGVGKTRLALAAAAQITEKCCEGFADGVVVVDLAPVHDPEQVPDAIARACGFTDTGQPPLRDRIMGLLRERELLLVLDNFEQVLPMAAVTVAELLASCRRLTMLVTSRVPMHLRWEQVLRIAPLPVPDLSAALPPLDDLLAVPSVQLFVGQARAHRADFALTAARAPLVAQLVAELDGLPLALELAAARLDALPLATFTHRMGNRLQLLAWEAPDLPVRHRSLAAAVGWSYDLLDEPEQRLFRCLGVFAGHVALGAIAAVVAAVVGEADQDREADETDEGDALTWLVSLAEKSLVLPMPGRQHSATDVGQADQVMEDECDEDPEPAFRMLETVREYAQERLARQGELEAARQAHAHAFLALAERAEPELRGGDQRAWFFRLEREQDNLRAALRWLLDQDDPAEREAALRLAGALRWFWVARGYHAEGVRWLEEGLARAPAAMDPAVRTKALIAVGALLTFQGAHARAQGLLKEALALAQERHDGAGSALALTYLGVRALFSGETALAVPHLEEALRHWRALGEPHFIGVVLYYLGTAAQAAGHCEPAAARYKEALCQLEASEDARLAGSAHFSLGALLGQQGDLPAAVRHVRAGLEICVRLRDRWVLSIGARVASVLVRDYLDDADPARPARLLGAADALKQATGAALAAWEHVAVDRDAPELRQLPTQGEWAAAYREGRSLPFKEVAALALTMLDEIAQTLASPDAEFVPGAVLPAQRAPGRGGNPLTERECEVLRLVAQGLANKAIARQLIISPSTVNYHLTSIFNKLGVDTRAQAVAVMAQRGLL
jgi:non-specific serine/threonine protein kinase